MSVEVGAAEAARDTIMIMEKNDYNIRTHTYQAHIIFSHPHTTLGGRYYGSHFTEEDNEAQAV